MLELRAVASWLPVRNLLSLPANSAALNGARAATPSKVERALRTVGTRRVDSEQPLIKQIELPASGDGIQEAEGCDSTIAEVSAFVLRDRDLVDQCLAHQPGAWSQMYARFQAPLVASVRAFLGPAGRDPYLVDEISARVWYALVRDDFWLLSRFDVRRGCRFSTFLSLIAKAQARLLLRSERRRRSRERAVAKFEIEEPNSGGLYSLSGEEFIATLSPAERTFLVDVLVASTETDMPDRYSRQNLWQLRHRVREKLIKFLE